MTASVAKAITTNASALPISNVLGGGGALHAGALIREVGLKAALVPRFPGINSALGCVIADIRHDQVRTVNLPLEGIDAAALADGLRAHGHRMVKPVENASDLAANLRDLAGPGDLIVCMGAGDITRWAAGLADAVRLEQAA